ncbi:MAG: hypothetical protein QOF83_1957 [Solirubrobacteraceae bacterium]|jgi:hypothetical protein|nr:hypothetical protein [Solirubrobacteraceae bacterium]
MSLCRIPGLAAVLAAVATLAGCGLGPGPGTGDVSLTVTKNFGGRPVAVVKQSRVPGAETVMRMLERHFHVGTKYGGGFVESINGNAGNGSRTDWFYYVNGIQAGQGAATTNVHRNDRVWFDLHDWHATDSIPAVVGSFPAPFTNGIGGKRLPTTVECASEVSAACQRVAAELRSAGVPAASQLLGTGSGPDTLGVVVGPWRDLASEVAASYIEHGPGASGVYARFAGRHGSTLELLDPAGHVVRRLGPGAGLVAATADTTSVPTWLITGTDAAGVSAAARALNAGDLHNHFALAVSGNEQIPIPVPAAG